MIKKIFDFTISLILLVLLFPIIIIIMFLLYNSGNKIFHLSKRIGKNKKIFKMPKFQTMRENTPQLATHLLLNPDKYYTDLGRILRKYSLDEIPQLFSVIKGDMSLVGPRPALFNQKDLIKLRDLEDVNEILPGITGLAQINGRDNLTIEQKVKYDVLYFKNHNFYLDLKILFKTLLNVILKKDIN